MNVTLTDEEADVIIWMIDIIKEVNDNIPLKATFSDKLPKEQLNAMDNIVIKLGGKYE